MPKFVILVVLLVGGAAAQLTDDDIPELKYLDQTIDPCQDFYSFTCGNFKAYHPLDDQILVDHFTLNTAETIQLAEKILGHESNRPDDPESVKKVRTLYKSCLDTDYADATPNPELRVVGEVNGLPLVQSGQRGSAPFSWNEVAQLISDYGLPMLFGTIQSLPHYTNNTKTQLFLQQESLLLPVTVKQEEYSTERAIEDGFLQYSQSNERSVGPFDIFLFNVTKKLQLATGQVTVTDEQIEEQLATMKKFMMSLYTSYQSNDTIANVEPTTVYTVSLKNLQKWTQEQFGTNTSVNWVEFLQIIHSKTGLTITEDTELMNYTGLNIVFYNIIKLMETTSPDVIKNYCLMRIFLYLAPDSDAQTRQAFEDYYAGINANTYTREQYCARKVLDISATASISYALAYEYQLRYFNVNKLRKATEMIYDLWDSTADTLKSLEWMDEESKLKAVTKVNNMITLLGYPEMSEVVEDLDEFYENLRVCGWDPYGNAQRLRAFRFAYQLSQGRSRDRKVWDKSPFDANAYYTMATNRIIFPVSMLNPVFFTGNLSVLDYARIGSIIGHEITHAFDRNGQQYNEDGLMDSWLTEETKTAMDEHSKCFTKQYDGYYVNQTGTFVNGTTSLNENLADNGGIKQAYRAVQKYLLRHDLELRTARYDTEQLFFIAYGTMWCAEADDSYFAKLTKYAPQKYRVNGPLANMPEFAKAFQCPVDSPMNPTEKCKLW